MCSTSYFRANLLKPSAQCSRSSVVRRFSRESKLGVKAAAAFPESSTVEEDIHPAYKKYRSIYELNTSELRKIERDEAHNVELPPPTALSLFKYVLGCIKFMLIPRPLRYLWYRIWIWLRAKYYPYHRLLVLKGCEFDYALQEKASQVPKIDRSMALRRFHWKVSLWENVVYRSILLKDLLVHKMRLTTADLQQKFKKQQPETEVTQ